MLERELFRLLAWLERFGIGLSIVAWGTVAAGVLAMAWALRYERRRAVWIGSLPAGAIALAANLADYLVTLRISPDLSLEANPIWRNVIDNWGLRAARWYGLSGKLLVSVLALQMFAFYLANRHRLVPDRASTPVEFLRRIGNRSRTRRQRLAALFTLFAFQFAWIQVLYLYIACLNWIENPGIHDILPSVPAAIVFMIAVLTVGFAVVTYRFAQAPDPDRSS